MEIAPSHRDDGFHTQTLAEAAKDPQFLQEIVECYIAIFNADGEGEWREAWTPETAAKKLFDVPAEEAARSYLTSWRFIGQLAGFSLVNVDAAETVIPVRELPPSVQTEDHRREAAMHQAWLAGPGAKTCFFREIGIRPEFRIGLEPVVRLMHDPSAAASVDGASFVSFWTSRDSKLFPIVLGLDARAIYDFGDKVRNVLMGDDLACTLRRFRSPLPDMTRMIKERLKQLSPRR